MRGKKIIRYFVCVVLCVVCVEFVAGRGQAFGLVGWGLWVVCNERSLWWASDTSGHEARKLGKIFEASTTLKGGNRPPKLVPGTFFSDPKTCLAPN
jgi:hypothetical protein